MSGGSWTRGRLAALIGLAVALMPRPARCAIPIANLAGSYKKAESLLEQQKPEAAIDVIVKECLPFYPEPRVLSLRSGGRMLRYAPQAVLVKAYCMLDRVADAQAELKRFKDLGGGSGAFKDDIRQLEALVAAAAQKTGGGAEKGTAAPSPPAPSGSKPPAAATPPGSPRPTARPTSPPARTAGPPVTATPVPTETVPATATPAPSPSPTPTPTPILLAAPQLLVSDHDMEVPDGLCVVKWSPVTGATGYMVEVAEEGDPEFTKPAVDSTVAATATQALLERQIQEGEPGFRIRILAASGSVVGPPSAQVTCRRQPLALQEHPKLTPEEGSLPPLGWAEVSWTPLQGIASYEVRTFFEKNSVTIDMGAAATTGESKYRVQAPVEEGVLKIRVTALGSRGEKGPPSESRWTIKTPPRALPPVTQRALAEGIKLIRDGRSLDGLQRLRAVRADLVDNAEFNLYVGIAATLCGMTGDTVPPEFGSGGPVAVATLHFRRARQLDPEISFPSQYFNADIATAFKNAVAIASPASR